MRIIYRRAGHQLEREIYHLIGLFFEDELDIDFIDLDSEPELDNEQEQLSAQLLIDSKLEIKEEQVCASISAQMDGVKEAFTYTRPLVQKSADLEATLIKQCHQHALLQVLESLTGLKQPWGILTGVRPTKIMHRLRREQRSAQEVASHFQGHLLLTPEKAQLLEEIVRRQVQVIPDFDQIDQEVSIYIGIPFCPTKCAYCTFPAYAINRKSGYVEQFLQGLALEIEGIGQWLQEQQLPITTIYLGGGTPTSIEAEEMDELFRLMEIHFGSLTQVREITVEAGRPDTITPEKLAVLSKWPVHRISINPQSFTDETLEIIGRHHTVKETIDTYHLARRQGFDNINMDLIIGLPGEGLDELTYSLQQIEVLKPESLTVHTLSFKRASTMTKNKDQYEVARREEILEMMRSTTKWSESQQYKPYYLYRQKNILGNLENIGYALAGKESMYNILMMEEVQTIIGLGCGAVSKLRDPSSGRLLRWANPKDPKTYIEQYPAMIEKKIMALNSLYQRVPTKNMATFYKK